MKRFILLIVSCLVSQLAWAGWVITYKDAQSGETRQEYYQGGMADFDQMIYTGHDLISIDSKSKSYWQGTPTQYCQGLRAQYQKMQAQLASMPAQYRPKPISQRKVTRKKLGVKTIAGFKATGYRFYVDGSEEDEVWVSSDAKLSEIIEFRRAAWKKMSCLDDIDSIGLENAKVYKNTTDDTVVLKESFQEVVKVEQQKVPTSRFKVPAGYRKFADYQQFVNHAAGQSTSTSQTMPSFEMPDMQRNAETRPEPKHQKAERKEESVIEKDAKEIGQGAVEEARQSTKQGIQEGMSEEIQEGVKNLMNKLFN